MENTHQIAMTPNWSGSLSYGWNQMKIYFMPLFLIVLVLAIVDSPVS